MARDQRTYLRRKRIALNIEKAIADSGKPVWKIAQDARLHYNTVCNWMYGNSVPSAIGLAILAETLGVTADELLKGVTGG